MTAWNLNEDQELQRLWGTAPIHELAGRLGRSIESVKKRAYSMLALDTTFQDERLWQLQDVKFIEKMTAAIRAGKEIAPIGVNTTPCTNRPKFIPHQQRHMPARSLAGHCAEGSD